jgi:hypothetical protein
VAVMGSWQQSAQGQTTKRRSAEVSLPGEYGQMLLAFSLNLMLQSRVFAAFKWRLAQPV